MENKCNVFFPVGFAMFAHSQRGLASDAFRHERRLVTPASIGEIVYVAVGAIYIAAARDLPQVGMEGHYLWFVHGNPHFLTQSQLWTVVGRPLGFKQFVKKMGCSTHPRESGTVIDTYNFKLPPALRHRQLWCEGQ